MKRTLLAIPTIAALSACSPGPCGFANGTETFSGPDGDGVQTVLVTTGHPSVTPASEYVAIAAVKCPGTDKSCRVIMSSISKFGIAPKNLSLTKAQQERVVATYSYDAASGKEQLLIQGKATSMGECSKKQ